MPLCQHTSTDRRANKPPLSFPATNLPPVAVHHIVHISCSRVLIQLCAPAGARLGSMTLAMEMSTTFCSASTPLSQLLTTMWCSCMPQQQGP